MRSCMETWVILVFWVGYQGASIITLLLVFTTLSLLPLSGFIWRLIEFIPLDA